MIKIQLESSPHWIMFKTDNFKVRMYDTKVFIKISEPLFYAKILQAAISRRTGFKKPSRILSVLLEMETLQSEIFILDLFRLFSKSYSNLDFCSCIIPKKSFYLFLLVTYYVDLVNRRKYIYFHSYVVPFEEIVAIYIHWHSNIFSGV
jgi:hypothetical protein